MPYFKAVYSSPWENDTTEQPEHAVETVADYFRLLDSQFEKHWWLCTCASEKEAQHFAAQANALYGESQDIQKVLASLKAEGANLCEGATKVLETGQLY